MTQAQIIKEWIESTEGAIRSLEDWKAKLEQWDQSGCNNGDFQAALLSLQVQGLEDWLDGNPAGLDALVEAVTGAERLAQQEENRLPPTSRPTESETASSPPIPADCPPGRGWWEKRYVNCGKSRCKKCKNGPGHGPYRYRVWWENGRRRTRCVGRW
jgi:hypothetical protein